MICFDVARRKSSRVLAALAVIASVAGCSGWMEARPAPALPLLQPPRKTPMPPLALTMARRALDDALAGRAPASTDAQALDAVIDACKIDRQRMDLFADIVASR